MNEYFEELAKIILSVSVVAGFIGWFLKKLIEKFFDADIEKYKIRLQSELENQRSSLQLEYHKNSNLHNEQCQVVKNLFQKYRALNYTTEEFLKFAESAKTIDKEKFEKTFKSILAAVNDLDFYFQDNRILIRKELVQKIESTNSLIYGVIMRSALVLVLKFKDKFSEDGKFLGVEIVDISELSSENKAKYDNILKEIKAMRKVEIQEALNILEDEFRMIFGVK